MSNPRYTVENHEPSQSIGYLIKRCGALMTQIAERRFESTNVSFTQWATLMTLCNSAEPISATQLSNNCGHDMGALTRVVDELERRGLVRRERSRRDRRAVEIGITHQAVDPRPVPPTGRGAIVRCFPRMGPRSIAESSSERRILNTVRSIS